MRELVLGGILGISVLVQAGQAQPFIFPLSPQPQRNSPASPPSPVPIAPGANQPGDAFNPEPNGGTEAGTGAAIDGSSGTGTNAPPSSNYGYEYGRPPQRHSYRAPRPTYYYPN